MASVTQSTYTDGRTYADIIQEMNDAGIKTTRIRQGREADFEDYGNALSSDVKHMLMDSFDCEQDYVLQQRVAGLFTNRNAVHFKDFVAGCKNMGLTITRESVRTSYISDYKGGNFSNSVRNGAITVYTISDGKGGEIKIADTNGNGAIESEELFMNQILGDLNMELTAVTPASVGSYGSSGVAGASESDNNSPFGKKAEVSQEDFNKEVEEYLMQGYSQPEAELHAGIKLNTLTMTYTGSMEAQQEKASQNEYNSKVDSKLFQGYSVQEAENVVNAELGVSTFSYTGTNNKTAGKEDVRTEKKAKEVKEEKEKDKSVLMGKVDNVDLTSSRNSDDLLISVQGSDLISNSNKLHIMSMIKNNKTENSNMTNLFEQNKFNEELQEELEKAMKEQNIFAMK